MPILPLQQLLAVPLPQLQQASSAFLAAAKKRKQDRLHREGQPSADERRRQQEERAREMIRNLHGGLGNIGNTRNIENQNIILYNSLYPNGYNLERSQLNNRILCKKSKIKMSKSQQGIKKDSISKYIGVYQDQNSWFCEIAHNRIKYKKSFIL